MKDPVGDLIDHFLRNKARYAFVFGAITAEALYLQSSGFIDGKLPNHVVQVLIGITAWLGGAGTSYSDDWYRKRTGGTPMAKAQEAAVQAFKAESVTEDVPKIEAVKVQLEAAVKEVVAAAAEPVRTDR